MSKSLVIVESPSKARTISRILGKEYTIMASMGHVRDLPEKRSGVDIKNNFTPEYELTPSRKKVIGELTKAAKDADDIYLATDPDREGEAIAWHIYEILKDKNKAAKFHRVTFHEITRPAVEASFNQPSELDMDRVNAQQARRILDRLVGYQVSPLLQRRVERGTSAGRVQSVALRLICEREELINNFTPEEYWLLTGRFEKTVTKEDFTAKLVRIDDQNICVPKGGLSAGQSSGDGPEINSEEIATGYADDAQKGDYFVSDVKRTPRKRNPKPPFITSTLQQAASANLRMSPEQTMRVAQQLYEGVESGGDSGGFITYMRTDSVNVSKVAQDAAQSFIQQQFGAEYAPAKPPHYRSKKSAQEAHEAIRPTDISLTPDQAKRYLDDRQARLYTLIWNRFMASQMAPAQLMQYSVEISNRAGTAAHKYTFRATSTAVEFPGFMKVYNLEDAGEDKGEDDDTDKLPELETDDACDLQDLDRDQKFTEPPPRFSEAMLVRELESNGVGRPSTYASIINTIKQRDYVDKDKGKLVPTDRGKNVNTYLCTNLNRLFEVDFTAWMEGKLDEIEHGDQEWVAMLEKFYGHFREWLDEAKGNTNAPPDEDIKPVLELFHDDIKFEPPVKRGKRTYDDKKFCKSLEQQMEKGKRLSERQWLALLRMAAKYEQQLPGLQELAVEHGFQEALDEMREKQAETAAQEPDEAALKLCALLTDNVTEWEEPQGKQKRNDKEFIESIQQQARQKSLSDRQMNALKTVVRKYHQQIPDYDAHKEELDLMDVPDESAVQELKDLLALADDVKEWAEPVKRGRRTYDDKSFVESLKRQLGTKGRLSPKQIAAFGKVLQKYKEQIPNFDERTKDMELPKPGGKDRPADEPTDITCPECKEGKLVGKHYRGRKFYGCNRYPKCKFSVSSLDKLPASE